MAPSLEEQIYSKLVQVLPDLPTRQEAAKLKASGFMDLSVDILARDDERIRIALSHYYSHPSGDLIPDPDMEIAVDLEQKTATACTFQDSMLYQEVNGPRLQGDLNRFLTQWLTNLIDQGHSLEAEKPNYKTWVERVRGADSGQGLSSGMPKG